MRSLIRLLILKLLEEKGQSGYSIIKQAKKRCCLKLSTGSVYPILDSLLRTGEVNFINKGRKKVYYLTDFGKKRIKEIHNSEEKIISDLIGHLSAVKIICSLNNQEIMEKIEND